MRNIIYFFCFCALPLTAQKTQFDLQRVQQLIHGNNQTYDDRFRVNDPAYYTARYTADACILPEGSPRVCGLDNIRAYYYHQGQNRDLRLKITATEISGGPETVVEEGAYALEDMTGKALDQGKFIATWKREGLSWKLHREIWTSDVAPPAPPVAGYDSTLAKTLGADDYGMKAYVLVLLKTGPADTSDKALVDSLFAGHMANMGRLAEAKKLVLAGPIGKREKYRGLFVFQATMEEARALAPSDPAIQAGLLEPEFMPYYGSAALQMVNEWHEKVQKVRFK